MVGKYNARVDDGVYVACPVCGALSGGEGWTAVVKRVTFYRVRRDGDRFVLEEKFTEDVCEKLEHSCRTRGTVKGTSDPNILRVVVRDGKIVDVGEHLLDCKELLCVVCGRNGLELSDSLKKRLSEE